jgi:hypothetical protein
LNGLIIEQNQFQKFKNENKKFNFFIDMDNYNYDNFQVEWLEDFSEGLHEKITKNQTARRKIKDKLKDKIIQNDCDKRIREVFFKYYD